MTTIRSARSDATPRSWVTRTTAAPVSARRSSIRSSTRRWTVTSRAEVGSSAMMSSGSKAMAAAIRTRCFIPPDSSCGILPGPAWRIVDPHPFEKLQHASGNGHLRAPGVNPQCLPQAVPDPFDRVEGVVGVLGDEPDAAPPDPAQCRVVQPGQVEAVQQHASALDAPVLGEQPDDCLGRRRLAGAGLPHQRHHLARADVEADAVDDGRAASARLVGDHEVFHGEHRGYRHGRPRLSGQAHGAHRAPA